MNTITMHGKVVKPAKMVLVTVNNEPDTVAVFTVADIGLPYRKSETVFIQVNYRKEAAVLICKYLVEGKEVLIHGTLRQKYLRNEDGQKTVRYYIAAETVELLPLFNRRGTDEEGGN